MFDDTPTSLRQHLPGGSYLTFLLIAGVMAGLGVWSLISSPRIRAASEDRDVRGQLQTELRALVGSRALAPAGQITRSTAAAAATPAVPLSPPAPQRVSWKLLAFVLLIGVVFTLWATINYYAASTTEIDDLDAPPASAPAAPLVVIPDWVKTAVRVSRDGVVTLDTAGRIMTANPAAEKLLGAEPGRLPGQKAFDYVPDLGTGADSLRRFSQVASATTVTANSKDGTSKTLELALHRVSDKGDVQYLATFHMAQPVAAAEPVKAVAADQPPVAEARPHHARLSTKAINEDALNGLENQVVMMGGYSELVVAALDASDPARIDAEAVSRSAARAALLCHEIAPIAQPNSKNLDLNAFVIAVAAPLARVLDEGCEVKGFRGQGSSEVWADPDLLERSICSLAWRTQELAGGLKRVSISVSNGRLDLRMVPAGVSSGATPAAFDALQAIDWIEGQNGTIEMEEHSEAGVRFRIWLPAAAQPRQARLEQSAKDGVEARSSRGHAAAD